MSRQSKQVKKLALARELSEARKIRKEKAREDKNSG